MSLVLVTAVLGASKLRGFIALFLGLLIGMVGLDLNTGQPRLAFGTTQLADPLNVVVVAVGIFALGEALWVAAHLRRAPLQITPVGQPFLGREDWSRSWGPWLRGTALGFPFGAIPAGGAETPTFLSLPGREEADQAPRGVRPRRHRGRRRPGGRQQRLGRRHPGAAARARPAGHRDRLDHARGVPRLRHRARPAADGRAARPGVDAARQPADRQHPAAGHQPAARARSGPGCCASPGRSCTPASCSSPRSAPTRPTWTPSTSSCCWSSACSGWPCAASGCRCCR